MGGNVIGVEFATLFAELGVRVTLIEMMERILPGEEGEAAALLAQELKKSGGCRPYGRADGDDPGDGFAGATARRPRSARFRGDGDAGAGFTRRASLR